MRSLSDEDASALAAGDDHYRAYVGPPGQYDLMGATQFMLLVTLGLRESHRVLDFGCGSLRAGRLLIPYLASGHYHGLEPNRWLVEDGLARQLGRGIEAAKAPRFVFDDDFQADGFGATFDVILCQSIFSHAGPDLMARALASFRRVLREDGLVALTVLHPDRTGDREDLRDGWTYPGCVSYAPARLQQLFADAGLHGRAIPWYHPRQTWYLVARTPDRLPPPSADACLRGPILDEPAWADSLRPA